MNLNPRITMKAKLKFVFNILLLSIFDAALVLNVMEIYEKYPSFSIVNNVILLVITLVVGLLLLKDTYIQARDFINNKLRPEVEEFDEDEFAHEDFY